MNSQTETHTGRYYHLLEKGDHSDLTLIVGEAKERIRAHKLLLMVGSPVFKKILTDDPKKCEIEIPQIEPDVLWRFLQYVYTGEMCGGLKYAIPLLNAGRVFQIPDLINKSTDAVRADLITHDNDTILEIFQQTVTYAETELMEGAVRGICKVADEIVETEGFLELSAECIQEIVSRDDLAVHDEMQFFEACVRWAEAECKRQGSPVTPKYCRSVIENLIPHFRFPQMNPADFSLKVAPRNILTTDELVSVLLNFNIPASKRSMAPPGVFNSNPRLYKTLNCEYSTARVLEDLNEEWYNIRQHMY